MKAISTGSGAVMFVPDEIERKSKARSYKDIVGEQDQKADFHRKILTGVKTIARKIGITNAA